MIEFLSLEEIGIEFSIGLFSSWPKIRVFEVMFDEAGGSYCSYAWLSWGGCHL